LVTLPGGGSNRLVKCNGAPHQGIQRQGGRRMKRAFLGGRTGKKEQANIREHTTFSQQRPASQNKREKENTLPQGGVKEQKSRPLPETLKSLRGRKGGESGALKHIGRNICKDHDSSKRNEMRGGFHLATSPAHWNPIK